MSFPSNYTWKQKVWSCAPGDCVRKRRNRKTRVITTQYIDLSFFFLTHLYILFPFFHREERGKR